MGVVSDSYLIIITCTDFKFSRIQIDTSVWPGTYSIFKFNNLAISISYLNIRNLIKTSSNIILDNKIWLYKLNIICTESKMYMYYKNFKHEYSIL